MVLAHDAMRLVPACHRQNDNLEGMTKPNTAEQRASLVHQYRASGLSQDAFCAHLEATEGIHLAPRTLRAWAKRFGQRNEHGGECAEIAAEAVRMLQGLLGRLQVSHAKAARADSQAGHPEDATCETSRVAAIPASAVEAPSVAARRSEPEPVRTPPTGPGGNAHATIEFLPVEEPPAPEQPLVRRKGRVVFDI